MTRTFKDFTSSLILSLLSLLLIEKGETFDDGKCNKCIDSQGASCDEIMRRFAITKYWVPKDDTPQTFVEAVTTCVDNGFMMAEVSSAGDQASITELAQHAGHEEYWIGAMNDGNGLLTPDGVDVPWKPPVVYGSLEGSMGVTINMQGDWHYSPPEIKRGTICQYPWNHPCLQENLKALSGRVDMMGWLDDPNNSNCTQPLFQGTQFIRTGPNSKYLMPKDLMFVSHLAAYRACRKLGLEPAVLTTFHDLIYLAHDVVQGKRLIRNKLLFKFALGGFDIHYEGVFSDVTTNRTLPLQVFDLRRKNDYYNDLRNCLALECSGNPPLCYHSSQFCNEPSTSVPLCQYKRTSSCYTDSPLGLHERGQEDKLISLGSTALRHYYGGTMQKSWRDAKAFCTSFNYQLLDFIKDDTAETEQLRVDLVGSYRTALGARQWMGLSWTSGYFPEGYAPGNMFKFENEVEWEYNENEGHFEWLTEDRNGSMITVINPVAERCLLLLGGGSERSPFYVRPVVCNLPNFFICYEDIPPPTEAPETTLPPETEAPLVGMGNEKKGRCNGEPVKISFEEGGLTNEEVEELIKDSQKYNFSMEYADGLKIREESSWRIPHVKGLGYLTQVICPDEWIPREYINLLMNFVMIFYHNANETQVSPISEHFWRVMEGMYLKCAKETKPLELSAVGGFVRGYVGEEEKDEVLPIFIEEEVYDSYEYLDYVMEGLWFMHQLSAAACYKTAESRSKWITDYHLAFRNDFVEILKEWWVAPAYTNYGLLFGDLDLLSSLSNLRSCAQAAFQRVGIVDRMFPRPLTLNDMEGLVGNDLNMKIGKGLEIGE